MQIFLKREKSLKVESDLLSYYEIPPKRQLKYITVIDDPIEEEHPYTRIEPSILSLYIYSTKYYTVIEEKDTQCQHEHTWNDISYQHWLSEFA